MAKVKNISGADLRVPAHGGLILAGQVLDLPDEAVYGLTCQAATWKPADKAAEKAHAVASGAADDNTPEGD